MKNCPKCNTEFDPGKWNKNFCSRKCSNSRTFSEETNLKRSISNKKAIEKFSEEDLSKIEEKRLETYRKTKPVNLCRCGTKIPRKNKHNMCWECYIKSDISLEARGHHYKNYQRLSVVDSFGNNVRLLSSMEIRYYEYLTKNSMVWKKPDSVKYIDNTGKSHWYKPDFYLVNSDETIEIKGHWWNNDKIKMQWVVEQNPNLQIKIIMKKDLLELDGG